MDSTLIVGILSFIGILVTLYRQQKGAAENTEKLNALQHEITISNRLHDQKVQQLYRAREALIEAHKAYGHISSSLILSQGIDRELFIAKNSVLIAARAELNGLALAIDDDELSSILKNKETFFLLDGDRKVDKAMRSQTNANVEVIHYRITKLLEEITKT